MARPDQIKAVSDFIKKNNAALKKRNMYMVYGHKTRDELEKLIISRLIIDKMSRFTLITEFIEESDLLKAIGEKFTSQIFPGKITL
jgi:hypothetical protein